MASPHGELLVESADHGNVRVPAWCGLHPKTRKAAERYGAETAAVVVRTVVLVEVERLPRGERRQKPGILWLWWHGGGEPDLDLLWRSYCRRFDVEHFVRFIKKARALGARPSRPRRWCVSYATGKVKEEER